MRAFVRSSARATPRPSSDKRAAAPKAATLADTAAPPGLVYVTDEMPGLRRLRRGESFVYRGADGRALRDAAELDRIRRLAIPPAYTDVWICPLAHGHLQATGRDARGRKQYRYHAEWRMARDADKFARMLEFGAVLPRIRRRVRADLKQRIGEHPGRTPVLAALVRLLDTTLMRVGNDEYARTNKSYGLTTLRNRHAAVRGSTLKLRFRGKHGIVHEVALEDPRVARIARRCQSMPGQDLFEYADESGAIRGVGSADVNAYLREASGADFTAKDFRTWHATVHALELVRQSLSGAAAQRRTANEILAVVAARLGNTVAVCRKAYVHPGVLELAVSEVADECIVLPTAKRRSGLSAAEADLMAYLASTRTLATAAAAKRTRKS
jgi:DNA topoisomerase-1